MRSRVRGLLLGTVAGAATVVCLGMALVAPAAQAAFGVEKFVAANCIVGHQNASKKKSKSVLVLLLPKEPTLAEAREGAYTQAAGHPAVGITAFKINTVGTFPNAAPAGVASGGVVTHVRTDVAPGVSTNPEAMAKCSFAEFGVEALPGSGLFPDRNASPVSEIGENKVVVWAGPSVS